MMLELSQDRWELSKRKDVRTKVTMSRMSPTHESVNGKYLISETFTAGVNASSVK
jgi:hypothetical protein